MKVLVATEKPFAKVAVDGIRQVVEENGGELVLLEKYTSVDQFKKAVSDVEALIVRSDKVTSEILDAAKNLKIVVRAGAGYDNLDLEACTKKGVVAMNTPGQNSNAVAELAIGLMIYISRACFSGVSGTEISGKTLGIHAYGNVGKLVGRAASSLGMKVAAYDPFITDASVYAKDSVTKMDSIKDLYSKNQYVSIHIPATKETIGSIGYDLAMSMPKNGVLVNTARKEVIDEEGLLKALLERTDLKYVTDVAPERSAEYCEKLGTRFFATPKKMGAQTAEANINAGIAAAKQIVDFIKNGNRRFQLNK